MTAPGRTPIRDWPKAGRWVGGIALLLVIAVLVGLLAGVSVVRRSMPTTAGKLDVAGLNGTVDVLRDAHGIPQVYADTPEDLFLAQGYVQAQDRFWEMDFRRHVTAGRIAELLGPEAVDTDMYVRTMGWRKVAEQEYSLLAPETRRYLTSYSEGVNAYISTHTPSQMSLEYSVLALRQDDYKPEDWTPVDSLAWLKAMAWDLKGNMDDEIDRARLSIDRTPEQIAELYPSYPYAENRPIMQAQATPDLALGTPLNRPALGQQALTALDNLQQGLAKLPDLIGRGDGVGSNSWVVSGDHTTSGKPLLANDPHLSPSQPGIWYQMGLHCRTVDEACPFDVSGFTFAGFPGVIIGHNDKISWGLTNLDPDVTDLFLEQVDGKNYLYDGNQVPLTEHDEVIKIAGRPSKKFTVRSTRHGPLVSDVSAELSSVGANARVESPAPERGNGYAVALQWTALTPSATADAIFLFDKAQNWGDFRDAARSFAVPSQNLIYADVDGNIGYQAPGLIPIRKGGRTGDYPVEGWSSAGDWSGKYIPFDDLPHELNPREGFIVTANQAVIGPSYQPYLTSAWDQGYRSQRIRGLLTAAMSRGKVDVAGMTRIQNDTQNPMGKVLVPYLLDILLTSEYYADGQRLLAAWDFRQPADSAAAAYFNAVWSNLLRLTFHDQLRESLWPEGGQRWMAVVTALLEEPDNPWWDDTHTDGVVETRDTILTQAMQDARDELVRRMSVNPDKWEWGHLHTLTLTNQSLGISGISVVERLFNRGPIEVSGGGAIVNATAWDATEGYAVTAAPSMRMVVDLDNFDKSRWINLTGVSGHAFSRHYDDQSKLWADGRTLPWVSSKHAVDGTAVDRLELRPSIG